VLGIKGLTKTGAATLVPNSIIQAYFVLFIFLL